MTTLSVLLHLHSLQKLLELLQHIATLHCPLFTVSRCFFFFSFSCSTNSSSFSFFQDVSIILGEKTGSLERKNCGDIATLFVGFQVVGGGGEVVAVRVGVTDEFEAVKDCMEGRVAVDEGCDMGDCLSTLKRLIEDAIQPPISIPLKDMFRFPNVSFVGLDLEALAEDTSILQLNHVLSYNNANGLHSHLISISIPLLSKEKKSQWLSYQIGHD
ncbi:hypothetical protein VNO78_31510 [Psophocarpus tetragonolobus]|uniref:Uncharacterized protein n=1 Tax=Psophocarpus tetragonolobus TaxID=3891 RepID=A0AAN9S0H4_PSOTE